MLKRVSFLFSRCMLAFHSEQFCCIYHHYVFCFGRMRFVIKAFHTTRGRIIFTINIPVQPAFLPPRIFKIVCKTQMYSNGRENQNQFDFLNQEVINLYMAALEYHKKDSMHSFHKVAIWILPCLWYNNAERVRKVTVN